MLLDSNHGIYRELGGASCRSSHVRNAPLATVGLKKGGQSLRANKRRSSLHSITSLAATSMAWGTVRPSALAVFKLITSSNLIGT